MKKFLLFLFALFLLTACGGDDPEPVSVRGALNGACYPNKTCNEGLDCSEENICVKIENGGENGNSDENSGSNPENSDDSDSSSGNEPSDGGDSVSDDENTDSGDSAPDSDSTGNGAECGNGTKEAGELCEKGEKLACSELDAQYPADKSATCNDYCNGWNTNECTGAATVPPRGTFPAVTFEIDYLYKGMDAFNAGENQDDEQYATGLFETSIALSDGSVFDIPHPQANVHWISAYYIENTALVFNQTSYYCEGSDCSATSPMVEFSADLSALSAGKTLLIGISDKYRINFLVEDNADDCVLLVGYGTLTVDSVAIAPGSAGHFKFTTSDIGLYSVTMTPEGDVTNELEKAGYKICK